MEARNFIHDLPRLRLYWTSFMKDDQQFFEKREIHSWKSEKLILEPSESAIFHLRSFSNWKFSRGFLKPISKTVHSHK